MKLESCQKGTFVVVRVLEDISLNSDIGPLTNVVERGIKAGNKHIAFSFGDGSFLYTRHIATLVRCLEMLREAKGSLAVIHPNRDILDVLAIIDPEHMILTAESEDELVSMAAHQ